MADITLDELETDPHPLLARLRATEPVAWVPVLDGWLVTRRDLAMQVMRDAATFTVDDPRFSTGQVVQNGGTSQFSATFSAGNYTYYCSVDGHRQAGMQGTLTVK